MEPTRDRTGRAPTRARATATALLTLTALLLTALVLTVAVVAGSAVKTVSAARDWASFANAFPMRPCQDGWAGCLVRDQPVSAELRGTPAHWRVDWWTMEPTGAFSPFPELSPYLVTPREPLAPVVIDIAEVAQLGEELDEELARSPKPRRTGSGRRSSQSRRPLEAHEDGSCSDLGALEPGALVGGLSTAQIACLENNLVAAEKMTDKGKISRVLMINAYVAGDKKVWEQLVRRHLDEIDQSDPDLSYKYALHLAKGGHSRAQGVIRWATVALDNKSMWSGDVYTSRVFSLHRVRAAASEKLWQVAAEQHADDPTDETKAQTERYRTQTKTFAREWAEYGRDSGKDIRQALALCRSAASDSDACDL